MKSKHGFPRLSEAGQGHAGSRMAVFDRSCRLRDSVGAL